MIYPSLLAHWPIISDQIGKPALSVVLRELENMLEQGIPGDVAELGCYAGTTSLFIRRLLDAHADGAGHAFHAYDSFAGLPPKTNQDISAAGVDFRQGALAVSKKTLLQTFRAAHLQPPVVHKAWFDDLTPADLPPRIAFAFLDGDFYQSILASLRLVWPRLSPGACVVIDDYQRETLPGVARAVRDFLPASALNRLRHEHNIAIIKV